MLSLVLVKVFFKILSSNIFFGDFCNNKLIPTLISLTVLNFKRHVEMHHDFFLLSNDVLF